MKIRKILIIIFISLALNGCYSIYTAYAPLQKAHILNYKEDYTKRVFLNNDKDVPEYIEITLLTKDNMINEINEMTKGFTYEKRIGFTEGRWILKNGKSVRADTNRLSKHEVRELLTKIYDIDNTVFKITLWGLEPFVSDHQFNFSLADNINPHFKDYKIEYIQKFSKQDKEIYGYGFEKVASVYSEVFLLIFDHIITPKTDYLTIFIDGKYKITYGDFQRKSKYNSSHKEVTFNLKD